MTKKKVNPIETVVLIEQLVQKSPMTSREIEDSLQISAEATIFALQLLLEQNKIAINSHNQYYIQHGKT
jgi:ATP-dependent DNA helicase RecQ